MLFYNNKIFYVLFVFFLIASITILVVLKKLDKKYIEKYEQLLKILLTISVSLCGLSLIKIIYNYSQSQKPNLNVVTSGLSQKSNVVAIPYDVSDSDLD